MGISDVFMLLTGISLFLFGMNAMGDGLKKVAGSKLEIILYKLSSTPLKGIMLGTGVTAIIQSSSATSVMVVGFVNSGMMKVRQAIGIIMGAIFGTSVTGWILCLSSISGGKGFVEFLSTASLTAIVAVAGVVLKMFCKGDLKHHIGDILLGFAVLMFGMSAMSSSVSALKESETFKNMLISFSNPFLGILAGTLITSVLQSASAAVGIMQALAITGSIDFKTALPIIFGIAIGASVPVLVSAIGTTVAGKRTAFAYLVVDVVGVLIAAPVFYGLDALVHFGFMDRPMTAVSIAFVNSVFRLAIILVLSPFIGLLEKLVCFLFKDNPEEKEEMAEIDRLEDRFLMFPALSLEQSRIAMDSMIRKTVKNVGRAFELLDGYDDEKYQIVQDKEEVIDKYEDKLGSYLVKITKNEQDAKQNAELSKYLHIISDVERIADHAVNISDVAKEIAQKKIEFSPEAVKELAVVRSAVNEIISSSVEAYKNGDTELARHVEPLEEVIDDLIAGIKHHHIDRLQKGNCTIELGFVLTDLLTNYERIADHCSNLAVAVIDEQLGKNDAHEYLNSVKNEDNSLFKGLYEEYGRKFNIG